MLRSMTALCFVLAAAPAFASPLVATVSDVVTKRLGDDVQLRIEMSASPIFSTHGQTSPPRLIVDLPDANAKPRIMNAISDVVTFVEVTSSAVKKAAKASPSARVTVGFSREVTYDVHAEGRTLVVTIHTDPATAALNDKRNATRVAALTPSTKGNTRSDFGGTHRRIRLAQDEGAAGAGTEDEDEEDEEGEEEDGDDGASGGEAMTYIGFRNNTAVSQVFARMTSRNAKYSIKREGENLVVLEIDNANIPLRNNRNHLDATYFDSPVKMITPTEVSSSTPKIRIIIEMKSDVPYEDKRDGVDIVLTFRK